MQLPAYIATVVLACVGGWAVFGWLYRRINQAVMHRAHRLEIPLPEQVWLFASGRTVEITAAGDGLVEFVAMNAKVRSVVTTRSWREMVDDGQAYILRDR